MSSKQIKAPPVEFTFGIGTMDVISSLNYSEERAFSEFIDNSVQSYYDHKKFLKKNNKNFKLIIEIITDKDIITIKDNAGGIHNDDWQRAFKVGRINPDNESKNEFGIGMKYSAIWMSPMWSLFTKAVGENFTKSVLVDQKKLVSMNQTKLIPNVNITKTKNTFTHIILKKVNHPVSKNNISRIKLNLSSTFRKYVNNKDIEIKIGTPKKTEKITWESPEIQKSVSVDDYLYKKKKPKKHNWKIDIKFSFGIKKKCKVEGWLGILAKGDTTNKYSGLFYFRKGRAVYKNIKPQIIFGSSGNTYIMQRITGELNFDNNIKISNDKSKFLWNEEDKNDFYNKLMKQINSNKLDILDQASRWKRDWEKKHNKPKDKKQHSLEKTLGDYIGEAIVTSDNNNIKKDPKKIVINQKDDQVIKLRRINYNNKGWTIKIVKHWGSEIKDWLLIDDPKNNQSDIQVTIRMAMNHNFVRTYFRDDKSQEGLLHLACYMVIGELSAKRYFNSTNPQAIRSKINDILNRIPPEAPIIKKVV